MQLITPSAGQAVYHDFIVAPTTCVPAKRLHAAFVVDGWLDQDRLEHAVSRVVAAHDSLRTAIEWIDGVLFQVVREPAEITDRPCEMVEWDGSQEDTRRIITSLDDWWTVPRALPVKVMVGRSPAQRTLLLCAFNHACSDGISAELVFDQIRKKYEAPQDSPLGRADVAQFADYYAAMLDDGLRVAYDDWVGLLDSVAPAVPQWMLERKLTAEQVLINVFNWSFTKTTGAALREAARRHLCTQFEILNAGVGIYFRRPDRHPAAIGVIHSGRHRPRGFEVAGLLRSFVVDAAEVRPDTRIGDAVATRREALRKALAHLARLPFEEVCQESGLSPGWRAGRPGQWEVELNGMFAAGLPGSMDGFQVHHADVGLPEEAGCENGGPTLLVSFTIGGDCVAGSLRYVRPPIDPEMAARVAGDLEETVRFLYAGAAESASRAPAFHRLVG
jgi:hypothetical protein